MMSKIVKTLRRTHDTFWAWSLLIAVTFALAMIVSPAHGAMPSADPAPIPTLNLEGAVGIGPHLEGTPYDGFKAIEEFEQNVAQHKMQYALWFQSWGDEDREFPTYWLQLAEQKGLIPVVTWEPWKRDFKNPTAVQSGFLLSRIAAGDHDEYIRSWAKGAREVGVPFILRYAHEQSTEPFTRPWYPWQGEPEHFKSSFRHIVDIFREEGATNVQFLWSAMWLNQWGDLYYPGDDVVDWIGTTILNHGTGSTADWARWRTFDEMFAGQYEAAARWNKPMMITEVACAEQGGDKALWLTDFLTSLQTKYPLVKGILILEAESDREWPAINWSVASSPQSLEAFRNAISSSYFK